MALIGEMKYLTIGGNTYSIPEPELPIASSSTLGGIKVGSGLTIDSSTGVLTATGTSITIDTAMSDSSTNTVQNKVIKSYVDTNIPTKVSDLQNDSGFTTNTGTVTSVRVQASSPLSSSTSTAQSTSLNTTISFSNQNKNLVLAGPSSGSSAAAPSFRSLVADDIPDLSSIYLTSFTETDPTVPSWAKASTKPTYTASEVGAVATSAVGAASGVAPLNASSKIDSTYLPSYVDDIIEGYYYNSKFWEEAAHTTEITGEAGKIYVDLSTNKTYRYSGTGYVEVSSGSLVTITRNLTSGTKSATINVDGTDYDIYSTDDTKNTAGSTDDTTNSLYIIGATSQGANPQTYSNKNFHIRGSYLYLGYNGTTTVTGLCFYYGSYYATMVYGGAITGDTYTPILKFSSATPANGVVLRNIANPRNDEDAVNRGYLISALSNKVSDYSFKTEDNYKQVIDLENYSGGFNISSTVYPDEEGTAVNATRWLNARFYDGALAIKAVDFTENNTSFNGYLAINKDEVNLGKINNNVVTSYIKIDNNGTTIKNVVTPTANTDAANKQYVDNKFSNITFPVTSVNGQTGAVTVTDQNVTQTAIQANAGAEYRLLLSNSTNDTTETSGVFKAGKLTYDPFYNRLILYPGTSSSGKLRMYYRDGFYFNLEPGGYLGNSSNYKAIVTFSGGNGQDVILRGISTPSSNNDATNKLYVDNVVTTQASIGSDGLITYKNSGNTSLYTVQLPLFDGGTGSSSSLYLPLTGGSLSGNLSIGGTTTSTGLITGNGGISTTVLTTSSNTTIGGNLSVSGTITSTGLLTASGGISTTTLTTSSNATIGGTLGVTGATTLGSTLGVTGAATLNSTLNVTGNTTVGGNLIIGGDIKDSNDTEVTIYNNAHMLGHAQVEGNTQLYGTLQAAGATTLGSTLDVTGDTTVNGVLDVKKFRCLKLLSAAGWYRVLTATPLSAASGAIVKFKILQYGDGNTDSVNHEVTLSFNKNGINFRDESSNGVQYVTKIRVNQLSSGYAVDIYYSDTTGRTIDVFFEPYIYAPYRNRFSANSLESVADSPTGETVKTVYDFHDSGAYFNDLSVGGVLDVTQRRCNATLSSAGWYRVLRYTAGTATNVIGGITFSVDFTLFEQARECHKVTLNGILGSFGFGNEYSVSNVSFITKIRYTYDSNNVGYVDIYYNTSSSRPVACFFDVHIRANSYHARFVAESLQSVAASPSGETVMVSYDFISSTDRTGSMTVGSGATSLSNVHIVQHGKMVNISGYAQGTFTASTTGYALGTITGVSMPSTAYLYCNGGCGSAENYTSNCAYLCITKSSGVLTARVSVNSTYITFNITYLID